MGRADIALGTTHIHDTIFLLLLPYAPKLRLRMDKKNDF